MRQRETEIDRQRERLFNPRSRAVISANNFIMKWRRKGNAKFLNIQETKLFHAHIFQWKKLESSRTFIRNFCLTFYRPSPSIGVGNRGRCGDWFRLIRLMYYTPFAIIAKIFSCWMTQKRCMFRCYWYSCKGILLKRNVYLF